MLQLLFSSAPVGALIRTKYVRSHFSLAKGIILRYIFDQEFPQRRMEDENWGRSTSLLAEVGACSAPGLVTPTVNGFLRPVEPRKGLLANTDGPILAVLSAFPSGDHWLHTLAPFIVHLSCLQQCYCFQPDYFLSISGIIFYV